MMLDSCWIIILCVAYQYVDHSWKLLQYIGLIWTITIFAFCLRYMYESPRYLYNTKQFTEAKQVLRQIALFNGISKESLSNFQFDQEYLQNKYVCA